MRNKLLVCSSGGAGVVTSVAGVVVVVRRLIEIVAPADGGISIGPARPTVRDEELTKSVRISL